MPSANRTPPAPVARAASSGEGLTQSGILWKVVYSRTYYHIGTGQIKYGVAYTSRIEGTGPHEVEVHGALIKDFGIVGGRTNELIYSFDPVIEHGGLAVGGTTDSYHNGDGKDWLVASGHYYDHGDNGILDGSCPGCIDAIFRP